MGSGNYLELRNKEPEGGTARPTGETKDPPRGRRSRVRATELVQETRTGFRKDSDLVREEVLSTGTATSDEGLLWLGE